MSGLLNNPEERDRIFAAWTRPDCEDCGKPLVGRDLLYLINKVHYCPKCFYALVEQLQAA